ETYEPRKWYTFGGSAIGTTLGGYAGLAAGTAAGEAIGTMIGTAVFPGFGSIVGFVAGAAIGWACTEIGHRVGKWAGQYLYSNRNKQDTNPLAKPENQIVAGAAAIGAAIGTIPAPGIGTGIGAAIGAGVGWIISKVWHPKVAAQSSDQPQ